MTNAPALERLPSAPKNGFRKEPLPEARSHQRNRGLNNEIEDAMKVNLMRGAAPLTGCLLSVFFASCSGLVDSSLSPVQLGNASSSTSPIKHVVLIIQENRSFDNLFATFPRSHGTTIGHWKTANGERKQPLKPGNLYLGTDITHCSAAFTISYDGGKMDGFNDEHYGVCGPGGKIGSGKPVGAYAYQYVDPAQIEPYWDIARRWVLSDEMFQTQGSGSFTAHQDLIRGGTAVDGTASNPNGSESLIDNPTLMPWGCDSGPPAATELITTAGKYLTNGPFPCSNKFPSYASGNYQTMRDLLDSAKISWKYYSPCFSASPGSCCPPSDSCKGNSGATLNAFDVIYPVRYGAEWGTNVSMPETNIFSDISGGTLPGVSWVIPEDKNSDHPGDNLQGKEDLGPEWVASVVNAVGESRYWKSSVVIVIWDDWGGFYDNAKPPFQDNYGGLGFRVPMLVVSPYDRTGAGKNGGLVSHTQYEFGSILKFIEDTFNLGSLGTTDQRSTSIGNVFSYGQHPRAFHSITSSLGPKYFRAHSGKPQRGDPE
ncbi:MAG TPA: alkaline phosphatase family protein [Candidatus Cybelea sp.]|nr:alkaline phosphatase family protein [Candidatus Cybelea sp.]